MLQTTLDKRNPSIYLQSPACGRRPLTVYPLAVTCNRGVHGPVPGVPGLKGGRVCLPEARGRESSLRGLDYTISYFRLSWICTITKRGPSRLDVLFGRKRRRQSPDVGVRPPSDSTLP
jgi:hypothetical protein